MAVLLGLVGVVIADLLLRTVLLLRLGKKVDIKGDYRPRDIELGSGKKQFVITLLGASSIYGEGSGVDIPFAGVIAHRLAKHGRKVVIHNLAVSGHKVADVVNKQLPEMMPSDLVVVYAGTKDCLTFTPTHQYLTDIQELTRGLQGKTVVWVTIGDPRLLWALPVWLRWLFHFRAKRFTALLKQVIARHPNEHWGIADFFAEGMPEARRRHLSVRQMVSDGIHLSDKGQKLVSDMVLEAYAPKTNRHCPT